MLQEAKSADAARPVQANAVGRGFLTLILLGSSLLAHAQAPVLNSPDVYMSVGGNTVIPTSGTYSSPALGLTLSANYSVVPSTAAQVIGSGASGTADLQYQFSINGPADTLVPIDMNLNFEASISGNATTGTAIDDIELHDYANPAGTSFSFQGQSYTNTGSPVIEICFSGGATGSGNGCYGNAGFNNSVLNIVGSQGTQQGTSGVLQFYVLSNSSMDVEERSSVGGLRAPSGTTSGTAELDPFISIDPGFSEASQFSVALSPGVGNGDVTPVPLPSTAWLLLSALGALGIVGRRRLAA